MVTGASGGFETIAEASGASGATTAPVDVEVEAASAAGAVGLPALEPAAAVGTMGAACRADVVAGSVRLLFAAYAAATASSERPDESYPKYSGGSLALYSSLSRAPPYLTTAALHYAYVLCYAYGVR